MIITIRLKLFSGLFIVIIIVIFTLKDDREDAGQGLMHADGYTMTHITDEGCANYDPTQAIIIILIIMIIL